jgi:hypothetical protein
VRAVCLPCHYYHASLEDSPLLLRMDEMNSSVHNKSKFVYISFQHIISQASKR